MSNEIKTFENSEFGSVRTVMIDDEPWLVGKDVAVILGYSNASKAVSVHVDGDDKCFIMLDIADSQNGNVPSGQTRTTLINESGLYSLVLSSKLPTAKRFKRWVTSEVLPSIRKHGLYAADELLADPDLFISALQELKAERAKVKALTEENAEKGKVIAIQSQQITEMKPKATYYDVVLNCPDVVTISVVAKDYGWSARRMNEFLHEQGIQFKQSDVWLLYQKYAECGYTCTKTISYEDNGVTHVRPHTYWTQKGRLFLYDVLKNNGVLPVVERN